jgi:TolB-like protein
MKRFIALLLVFAFSVLMPGTVKATFKKTKIAVLDFQLYGREHATANMGEIVSEWLITALVKEGRFDVVERRLLKKIMEEQKLVMSGIVDEGSATQLGKLLGVKAIISGSVMRFENTLEVNARIIDVESASIVAAESVTSTSATGLEKLIAEMAERIIRDFPLEGYVVRRDENSILIDLGKRSGVRRDMRFIVFKEGNVIKHPKTGEVLDVEKIRTGIVEIKNVREKTAEGRILEEKVPAAIEYGQMVESIVEALILKKGQPYVDSVRKEPVSHPKGKVTDVTKYINMLRSHDATKIRTAARIIYKSYSRHPELLEVINEELLKGCNMNVRDKNHVDAMAWLCNVLGASRQSDYKATLEKVAREARSKKLKKYAKKNLRKLK